MADIKELDKLREGIDECDAQLVALLARRNSITEQIGAIKQQTGAPLHAPDREATLLAARRQEAINQGVNPELVEDILRRMMREAYQNQQAKLACSAPQLSPIVIVGGQGAMGQLFAQQFIRSGYEVRILDKEQQSNAQETLAGAKLVMISVPINALETVVTALPKLDDDCLLVDITSVKQAPLKVLKAVHSGPVVGLHPMFGPDISHWVKQTVVVCEGRNHEIAQGLLSQLQVWGCQLVELDAQKHDEAMQIIQVMRHLTTFVYGQFLAKQGHTLEELRSCSSPIYQLELMMVGRLFAQSPELYSDIMLAQFDNVEPLLAQYQDTFASTLAKLKAGDKAALIDSFADAKAYFSDATAHFLTQSRSLLNKANDAKVLD
ncbi:bifunctional chorismate mutase/prephenate dehydrogenase [Pseudoalteromonas sp. SR44-5]|uniref:bifunctional chorismate mutase/prephenate dehydrogenase n=1 Tax=unclassified Pseudoalteromonas TaxID=194690 RepID=UPI001600DED7|nr:MULTISPECIES: bifunctional chorismate mutase/prephenate dehydrogenase [unclassified Pseudoalteromonas]MBB1332668.1 bifunctional chorismate mutase/prephenate dehydrogenase [Pseudoalteromonas sp. SR41-6]MBB1342937.1 bifunctional chorismate mutase/prephenate dehydrogenase [Pseudoalteromonas sp. SR45-6]MBB1364964.1 bifunctional chorismate mutase/prephenate dehydrogenase [Pseudoalteromonas sp. SR44-5]MBB1433731.1 bifunctional chorismate mutase/prephenate dehydrogenase [Pseudoalteromonas sp. SG43-